MKMCVQLMQPSNGMAQIRRNAYNVILALDLSKASSIATVSVVSSFVQRGVPVRMGIVPIVESDEGMSTRDGANRC